ncbi:FAD-binding oxidoreductase [Streptomyces sp. NPDC086023]|uniref:FAD-binding oxidoreductase n=1 Tax=Streptomyces sp. NPDC086023 TaxID=3365746 RepID=UPI0037D7E00A
MRRLTRRNLLAGATAVAGGATLAAALPGSALAADEAPAAEAGLTPTTPAVSVTPADPRYPDLARGDNNRWIGTPEQVVVVSTTQQALDAVQQAVTAGRRIAVRSGGHCYEDFTTSADVKVVLNLSEMRAVYYDSARRAFAIEAGASLGDVYEQLYRKWGVTIPGGSCPTVAAGGHIAGGGYGVLNRTLGLTVDHLYGVEVVVVDAGGRASVVVATRDSTDARLRDLWWAHTGGGGGNFGVVTRYFMRSHGITSTDPAKLLPRPPSEVWIASYDLPWDGLTQAGFSRMLLNFGAWHERNSAAGTPAAALFSRFMVMHRAGGRHTLPIQIDASVPGAEQMIADFAAAVAEGTGITPRLTTKLRMPWLKATHWSGMFGGDGTGRADFKSAYMRKNFTPAHTAALWKHLTREDYGNPFALVQISGYGGRTNTVAAADTAVPQRDSIMKLMYLVGWQEPAQDAAHIAWIRDVYREAYAETGGVPVPGDVMDGCFVNYCDIDLGDPAQNTSGVPWTTLYYKDNYPRLQRAKATWDPRNVFRHAQSVQAAS